MIQKRVLLAIRHDKITHIAVSTVYQPVQEPQVLLTIRLIHWPSTLQWLLPRLSTTRTQPQQPPRESQTIARNGTIAKQQAGGKVLIYERSHSEWEREKAGHSRAQSISLVRWILSQSVGESGELRTHAKGEQSHGRILVRMIRDETRFWLSIEQVATPTEKNPEGDESLYQVNKRSWRAGMSVGIRIKPKWSLGHLGHSEQVNLMCQKTCRHTAGVPVMCLKAAFDVITASGRWSVAS